VGAGAGIGIMAALLVDAYLPLDRLGAWDVPGVVPAAAVFMLVIGLLAAFGPARRGLRIEPTQALRDGRGRRGGALA
jgi:ABC-type antimicrobial peptide transport system permease subunit